MTNGSADEPKQETPNDLPRRYHPKRDSLTGMRGVGEKPFLTRRRPANATRRKLVKES
jgi:hypothetical protein